MILKILQYPDPKLLEASHDVLDFNADIANLISDMIETCRQTDNCVGLAAIQVGIPLRISVIKVKEKYIHIINPEIVYQSGEETREWEGCMSVGVGDEQLFSNVSRDARITVKYFTKEKKEITRQCSGFLAHAFQHEIDHMNGMLFLAHVPDPHKIWKDKDLNAYITSHHSLPA